MSQNRDPGDEQPETVLERLTRWFESEDAPPRLYSMLADIDARIEELRRDREVDPAHMNIPCDAAARVRDNR